MTLSHAMGGLDAESDYRVSIFDRLRELLFEGDEMVGSDVSLKYEWRGGYEVLEYHRAGGGSSHYGGSYHPNGVCEGGGVCVRCGCTLFA